MKTKAKMRQKPPATTRAGWRIRLSVHQSVRIAAAVNNTTCEELVDDLLARELSRMGHFPPVQPAGTSTP